MRRSPTRTPTQGGLERQLRGHRVPPHAVGPLGRVVLRGVEVAHTAVGAAAKAVAQEADGVAAEVAGGAVAATPQLEGQL